MNLPRTLAFGALRSPIGRGEVARISAVCGSEIADVRPFPFPAFLEAVEAWRRNAAPLPPAA
ncbi:MAG: hypothetical protein N2117_07890, partial [Anaerolineales bacterium]|nr:hypothetical protein [Anaerolineales bacterium]